ncbi:MULTISPECIES: DJ-1/PfpI family protein [unclassified Luteococcus]|uniref:DJ-1/PfpI family protein n=1 Tax=unclassified Luteococcus TaxID=2639923 RepID=UPI00313D6F02
MTSPRRISVVLFERFEVLDVLGPVELFSKVPGLQVEHVGPGTGPVRSAQGVQVIAETSYQELQEPDILLVPGGAGTRPLAADPDFLGWLGRTAKNSRLVTSVCTGSALLAAAGALDGYCATSNKLAFGWVTGCGPDVDWQPQARWVADRNRWTSSGVAAGMDMAHALIQHLHGAEAADNAARIAEYEPHRDSTWDPFAQIYGLS